MVDTLLQISDLLLHIDKHLDVIIAQYGFWAYGLLFAIVFAETGLVVAPFLPGDSLLFIAGAYCATGHFDIGVLCLGLLLAAVAGNTVNYFIGRWIGHRVFSSQSAWIDQNALRKTHSFYEKHGGKTIILARFLPIIRTFAPFIAGVSEMNFARFQLFNIAGAGLWIVGLVAAGYFFGNIPLIRQNLNVIVLIGVGAAALPILLAGLYKLLKSKKKG
ncbi:VTT domain-containing protein [Polynucleobacter sphagniphilus]|uniref:Membrane-associated protein n=1 Tax=Polynucleobacter sphagniphilus TaxID=1743169 RepID=A0AA43M804_9BURK|nr:VTT domain-containing protein [Polynucleobacter sphagniphilus]MDF9788718.1 membrane-associated protein [Polynucleobacter sphagniphilus]MDH6155317.1 membrane-associated protein [Polynucleobacter sphagniphilus]MDH6241886.1 membrane-associated protein [Polynucleobacter sphagniphilus]MDH6249222.1 membrane-associated protein [Polynucleobacter sphagniphilus]MDH6300195.1 membrane-associated protein [Polynucleobacter sphagniphilus]